MKRMVFLVLVLLASVNLFAGGQVDVSSISEGDVKKLESIVQALEPVYAIGKALELYPNESHPMLIYLKVQNVKINAVFNEYGVTYSHYATYQVSDSKIQITLAKLQSRYTFLDSLELKNKAVLLSTLESLK